MNDQEMSGEYDQQCFEDKARNAFDESMILTCTLKRVADERHAKQTVLEDSQRD